MTGSVQKGRKSHQAIPVTAGACTDQYGAGEGTGKVLLGSLSFPWQIIGGGGGGCVHRGVGLPLLEGGRSRGASESTCLVFPPGPPSPFSLPLPELTSHLAKRPGCLHSS